ncbi:hypothetical protein E0M62_12230 [Escherichia coli]|nr:hypothetical protein [Escherichia coli]QBG60914.1 hypothetical protein D9K49_07825 [Escherichia coli]
MRVTGDTVIRPHAEGAVRVQLRVGQAVTCQGKITKARSPQGLTPDSFCPWLLFASYVLTLP